MNPGGGIRTFSRCLKPRAAWTVAVHRQYTTPTRRKVLRQDQSKVPLYQYPVAQPTDTRVYVWGLAATGALGLQTSSKKQSKAHTTFVQHPSRLSFAERQNVLDVACGYGFTLYATRCQDGVSLWASGINTDGQLGFQKAPGPHKKPLEVLIYPAPVELQQNSGQQAKDLQIVQVAAGRAHQLALSQAGHVYALGNNAYGQCGRVIVPNEDYIGSPTVNCIKEVAPGDTVASVNCGQDHSFFLMKSGRLFSCGWSDDGQTGLGRYGLIDRIGPVEGDVKGETIVKVTGTGDTVLALNANGEVFGWGNTEYGQLNDGIDDQLQINVPRHLPFTKQCGKIVDIAAGGSYCLVLNDHGDVFAWGYGILGFGPEVAHQPQPRQIPPTLFGRNEFNPHVRVTAIACGLTHTAAVNDRKDLYMWGHNRYGCLGLGHKNDQFFPLKVALSAQVTKVTCGVDHTVALCKAFV